MQADLVRFIRGRVHFRRGGKSGPAPFPSAIAVFEAAPRGVENRQSVDEPNSMIGE